MIGAHCELPAIQGSDQVVDVQRGVCTQNKYSTTVVHINGYIHTRMSAQTDVWKVFAVHSFDKFWGGLIVDKDVIGGDEGDWRTQGLFDHTCHWRLDSSR